MLKRRKGQSTLEYAMIIAVVVGALLAMQVYLRRGVQGKLREATDEMGGQYSAGRTTSKVITEGKLEEKTTEKFGTKDIGGQGVSESRITAAGKTTVTTDKASGGAAENISVELKGEPLFEK